MKTILAAALTAVSLIAPIVQAQPIHAGVVHAPGANGALRVRPGALQMAQPQFKILSSQMGCMNPSTKSVILTVRNDGALAGKGTVTLARTIGPQEAPVGVVAKQTAEILAGKTATVVFHVPSHFLGAEVAVTPGAVGSKSQVAANSDACIF